MPFNGSGVFSIVNTFVPNTTILSAAVNQNFTDIASGLSNCLTRDNQAGMTAVLRAVSGTVSAPGLTFTNDTTSGLFLSASGVLGYVSHSLGMLLNTTIYNAQSATVQAGGSGYAVGDTIVGAGGTTGASLPAVFTVATLSGSAVSTVTVAFPGFYTATASNPMAQASTSGIGTGCTLNVTYNNPAGADYRAFFSDQAGGTLWQKFGASSFVSGLMNSANALTFAQGIGGTALNQVIGGTLLIPPQGILTPISSTTAPIPTTDQTAVTRIYWTPYNGNVCPIYNGTSFVATTSPQIFCDLTAGAQATGGMYDVYKFLNAGTVTLGLSPTWSAGTGGSVSAGSCARGTGAGGTALAVVNGLYVNAAAMTLNNSATTYNIAANQGTYLGSVYIYSTAGQYNCLVSYGQTRMYALYNAYNQRPLILKCGDATASWNYTTNTARPSNNAAANSISVFCGLPTDQIEVEFNQYVQGTGGSAASTLTQWITGIGWNSTTAFSGQKGTSGLRADVAAGIGYITQSTSPARYVAPPSLGLNVTTSLEQTTATGGGGGTTVTYNGTEANMLLTVKYRG